MTDFDKALANFKAASIELAAAWETLDDAAPLVKYPDYLPSFDEFVTDVVGWVRDDSSELAKTHLDPEELQGIQSGRYTAEGLDDDDIAGLTRCPEGCEVEPDGVCPHGYYSLFLRIIGDCR